MAIEIVVGIGVAALLLGLIIGYFIPSGGAKKARVTELENALETAQEELAEYKREVFGQFAETAEKFRALDQSYHDLHRHLAESSVALCGDAATPLLSGPMQAPETDALIAEAFETGELQDEVEQETGVQEADKQTNDAGAAEAGDAEEKKSVIQQALEKAKGTDAPAIVVGEAADTETVATEAVADETDNQTDIVPTLTEVDADDAKSTAVKAGQEKSAAEGDVDVDQESKRASA